VFSDFTLNFNPWACARLSFKPTVAIGGTVKATLGTPRSRSSPVALIL
jgi:hypothetical protein